MQAKICHAIANRSAAFTFRQEGFIIYGVQGCVVAIAYLASTRPEKQKAKSRKTDDCIF